MTETALYRHFGPDDELLYIGIATNALRRMSGHATAQWAHRVRRITIEMHPSREAALRAEGEAIHAERPLYNRCAKASPPDFSMPGSIFSIWPTVADMARDIGKSPITVRAWRQRGSIPGKFDMLIVERAKARGATVDLAMLAQLRANARAAA